MALIVEVGAGVGLFSLAALQAELTDLLGSPVDVVPAQGLKTRVRDEVLATAVPL